MNKAIELNNQARSDALQNLRFILLRDCIEYANHVHNNQMRADVALGFIKGRQYSYHAFYHSLAVQAHAICQVEHAEMFQETSKLFTPWRPCEFAEDRHTFDKLVAEVEMLEFGSTSDDVLFYSFGDLKPGDAECE